MGRNDYSPSAVPYSVESSNMKTVGRRERERRDKKKIRGS